MAGRPKAENLADERRCSATRADGERCGNARAIDSPGGFCAHHGGKANPEKRIERIGGEVLKKWTSGNPVEDVPQALLNLAGRLTSAVEYVGGIVEDRMETYEKAHDQWKANRQPNGALYEECVCCGHNPKFDAEPKSPITNAEYAAWRITAVDLGNLLTKISALGLLEREIAFREEQGTALVQIFSKALRAAGIDDETAIVVRGHVLDALGATTSDGAE